MFEVDYEPKDKEDYHGTQSVQRGNEENIILQSHVAHIIMQLLDQKDLCRAASVCKAWNEAAYDPSLWKIVDLPFPGTQPDKNTWGAFRLDRSLKHALDLKLYSTMRPPEDTEALEKLLKSMIPSKRRFDATTSVKFLNYMFSDKAIQLTAVVFPSLERLNLDGGRITYGGLEYLADFRNLRFLSLNCGNVRVIEEIYIAPLMPRLERLFTMQRAVKTSFLVKCNQCYAHFNPEKNSATSCFYHPGDYTGYGHSCSSFECCGSNTPAYPGTPGCSFGYHSTSAVKRYYGLDNWLPEFEDVPYSRNIPDYTRDRRSATDID